MTRARRLYALPTALLCAFFLTVSAYADSYARIVRLSDIDGDVQIDRNTGQGFEKAVPNLPITQGVRLETGSNGRAEIEFENGTALRLTSNTSVDFSQLLLRSDGARVNNVRVREGTLYLHYKHKGDGQFLISFGNRNLDLKKDANLRLQVDRNDAQVAVMKGEVDVDGASDLAKVKKNQTLTFDLADSQKYELAKGITELPTDNWDSQRTQYLDQYASARRYGNSPYAFGYSDLYQYGQFVNAPGYGFVWVPANMGLGWDPYQNGYWSYYPGSGYVWVSSYPWGWAPYRYGSWAFIPGAGGWAWVPGNWNRWNTGVAVNNPPPTWHHPTPPPNNSGGTVIVGQPWRPGRGNSHIPPAQPGVSPTNPERTVNLGNRPGRPSRQVPPPASSVAPTQNPSAAPNPSATRPGRENSTTPAPTSMPKATPAPQTHVERPSPSPHIERSAPAPRMESPHSMGAPEPRPSGPAPQAKPK